MEKIVINAGESSLEAVIDSTKNPKTGRAVLEALPMTGIVSRWGAEIYFETRIEMGREAAQDKVEVGDIAFWPEGNALCIFFGPTPVSDNDKPKAYSPVNVIGRITGDVKPLEQIQASSEITISRAT